MAQSREEYLAYQRRPRKRSQVHRREYFREYRRNNKHRLKSIALMGEEAKKLEAYKKIIESPSSQMDQTQKEQIRMEIKTKQVKNFLNIK